MMGQYNGWDEQDRPETRIWGKLSGTILGVKPYTGEYTPDGGYLPRSQYIYYGLDDGTILQVGDSSYLSRIWPLIGTRQNLAICGGGLDLLTEPKFGFEPRWTEETITKLLPEFPEYTGPPLKPYTDPDVEWDAIMYGRVERVEPDGQCLVDVGCGTITIPQRPHPLRPRHPVLNVGDYLRCGLTKVFIYNLPPEEMLHTIPCRLLMDRHFVIGLEHFMYLETKNGEVLYAFGQSISIEVDTRKVVGKVLNYHFSEGTDTVERLSEPRQGILSTYTNYKHDILTRSSPSDGEDFKRVTVGTGNPDRPLDEGAVIPSDKDQTIFEGILKVGPNRRLFLDTGIGTIGVPTDDCENAGVVPGDYVRITVAGTLGVSYIDYPVD